MVRDERIALGEVEFIARSREHRAQRLGFLLDEPGDDLADAVERCLLLGDGRDRRGADVRTPRDAGGRRFYPPPRPAPSLGAAMDEN
ncbi:hypothetical protein GCM10025870_12220 [Agromyces marinus]|uniref:Uncharacterized protein n=1 Tax=Agromyces marinus TaxID=1389020 RepID=A0ABM8H065_9MICO|nr:hypothetical protein GCM10025870_12220 [Agromyces marinus]